MQKNVLLTGATGAIGAALVPELLSLGFKVYCLVRPKGGRSAADRLRDVSSNPHVIAVAGDVTEPNCGVDVRGLKIDKLVHAAADTSLVDGKADAVIDANREGTLNALSLARALGNVEFHYVGTTYIAGDAEHLAEQAPGEAVIVGNPRNAYEASKYEAECQVRNAGLPFSIHRPAIVVGRSDDGSAPLLEGFYSCLKGVWKIRDTMWSGSFRDENGKPFDKNSKADIHVGVKGMDVASLNLIQLDWVSVTLAHLVALPARGRTYNLAHLEPTPLKQIVGTMFDALGLINIRIAEPGQTPSRNLVMIALNRFINREVDRFRPYLRPSPVFESRNVYADLGPNWPEPPAITRAFLMTSIERVIAGWRKEASRPAPTLSQRLRSVVRSKAASPAQA